MNSEFPRGWRRLRLDSVLDRIIDHRGRTPKKLGGDFVNDGVQVISAKNVYDGRLHPEINRRFVTQTMAASWMPVPLAAGDVLLTSEAPLGEVAYLDGNPNYCLGQRLFALRAGHDLDPRYLYFALQGPLMQRRLRVRATGTTAQGIRQAELRQLDMELPPLNEQRAIASILGSIDDKIESNHAISQLLHSIAEQAFRRALGASRPTLLGELGTIRGGGTPKSSVPAYWDPPEVAWITPKDMTALAGSPVIWRGERDISQLGLQKSSARLLPTGTVLYTSRATLGMIAIAQQELSTNQGFITVEPAPGLSSELVYFTLRENRDAIAAKANGSTFLEVNKTNFKAVECRIPDEGARAAFQAVAGPAFRLIAGLTQEAQRLRAVRDALLPKLVSGQIRVPAGVEPRGEAQAADLVESTA